MHSALTRLDLNLLLVFDALHRCRSVVAAADELAISPSACSHALARLRGSLGDELFVRRGSAMQPTSLAEQLGPAVAEALQLLSDKLGDAEDFSPQTSTQTYRFVATDFTTFALLPALIARVEREAPRARIQVLPSRHRDATADLQEAGAHFALGFSDEFSPSQEGLEALDATSRDYVVAVRRGHGRIGARLSLEQYLAERHVVVKLWSQEPGVIDTALTQLGLRRDVAVELHSIMAAPFIVANTDMLITLPRLVAEQLGETARIKTYPVPFAAPRYTLKVFFQRRHLNSRWHRWMREQILATSR
jgi:DNA-binding transcriptional LysR family regulator